MITITRLNEEEIIVHAAQIESLEAGVDTRVTLINGKQLFVKESVEEVVDKIGLWYRSIASGNPRMTEGDV